MKTKEQLWVPCEQLTQGARYQIYALRKTGHTNAEIVTVIGCHKSTVSRELSRNREKKDIVLNRHTVLPVSVKLPKYITGFLNNIGTWLTTCCNRIGALNKQAVV